jgi:4-hydroxy-tetrahydrodipicolinate reductase
MALSANKQTVIPIALCGAAGRMGREIFRAAALSPEICIVRAYEAPGHRSLGARLAEVTIEADDVPGFLEDCRVMVDFSAPPAAVLPHLEKAAAKRIAAVVGSTGLEPADRDRMEKLAAKIPILYAANMSLGINLLIVLAQRAQELLRGGGFDVDIIEAHHRNKKDAPSGTSLMIEHFLHLVDSEVEVHHHSLRAGDVVGEHTVQFTGIGERLELTHRAGSREAFARGVLAAVRFLAGKKPGMYDMRKVLGL